MGQVLTQYSEELPLTARQIFYILVAQYGYEKTDRFYARLCERLSKARRARLISFNAIRDDGTSVSGAPGWHSEEDFWPSVRSWARNFRLNKSLGQPMHVELWVEAAGMVPQASRVAHRYGVDVYSAGGFNSITDKYETAQRLANAYKPVIVLHVGDYDPSGCAIIDSLAEDVLAFANGLDSQHWPITFSRVAVVPEQIVQYSLLTAPQKSSDTRGEYMDETVQAEAFPPDVLAQVIQDAIEQVTDQDQLRRVEAQELQIRDRLTTRLEEAGL